MDQNNLKLALPLLRCPHCDQTASLVNSEGEQQLRCSHCGSRYSYAKGYIDFMPAMEPGAQGLSQKAMETPWVVSIYEDVFRPLFTALGSPIKYQEELDWLQRHKAIEPVDYVLDLAAGTGRYSRLLSDMYRPKLVLAVDISEPMLKANVMKSRQDGYDNIIAIRGDAHHLPVADRVIDYFNCFGALHLFPEPRRAINDIARVVKPGAVFSCLTAVELQSYGRRLLQAAFSRFAKFKFFTRRELADYLLGAGFVQQGSLQKQMLIMFTAQKQFS